MSRHLEVPDSIFALRRIYPDIYNWFSEIALPTVKQIIDSANPSLEKEIAGLQLMLLDETMAWPILTGFATECNSQFPVKIAGNPLTLKPLKDKDIVLIRKTNDKINRTKIQGKNLRLTPLQIGLYTNLKDPLTVQSSLIPQIRSWR